MSKIKLSSFVRKKLNLAGEEIIISANNLRELFEKIDREIKGFKECIFTEEGNMRGFIAIFLNGNKIDNQFLSIPIGENDEIFIINIIAGG